MSRLTSLLRDQQIESAQLNKLIAFGLQGLGYGQ